MIRVYSLVVVASVIVGLSQASAREKAPKEQRHPTGTLTVDWPTSLEGPKFVLVSLYRKGKLIRSRELERPSLPGPDVSPTWRVTWKGLRCGVYEVSFEAKGFAKGIKRVRVSSEDGDELVVHVELGTKSYREGDGLRSAGDVNKGSQ